MRKPLHIHKAIPNTGALDFRHLLDAPAGKRGFVLVKGEHMYFEDGTRARFIGFNLPTRSNTPDHATADKLAERFASMGVNVIRLHAADAPIGDAPRSWSSCAQAPLIDYARGSSRYFNKEGLDRFDYFAAKLKEKGIYLHIDLIVARAFKAGDGLDFAGEPDACLKCYTMINERLIELQQEYARALLCHVNPYTGLSLAQDPAVMTVQINNEDSVIKESRADGGAQPYRAEFTHKFNEYLLEKYGTRAAVKQAWTHEGACALGEDEDPEKYTVRVVEGSFVQPACDPLSDWTGANSPARYADYMEFGIWANRRFYARMKAFLRSIGVRAPIATSNLLGGAADVYGHIDGDIMENNSYFNHPLLPLAGENKYMVGGPAEYVSTNPLTMQRGIGALATTLISLAATAVVSGKPFALSEWNEYGLHPFHSTAYLSTVAYACLNDWDALILYCHHTSENANDQPDDEILNVFDCYNDPALICPWGFLATAFLKGLISPARNRVDVVYTQNDLSTLPNAHAMPNTFLPYITSMRQVFSEGEAYKGNANAALNAGFLNGSELVNAINAVYFAWSPYSDAFRTRLDTDRLINAARGAREIASGVCLSENALVFSDIRAIAGEYDYREFAKHLDGALKAWNVIPKDTGYIDGKFISDTGEIVFDPDNSTFRVNTPRCACFSGKPCGEIELSETIKIVAHNARITLTLMPEGDETLTNAHTLLLTAIGETGMDQTQMSPAESWHGVKLTLVDMQGKLFADTLEGEIYVTAPSATLTALDTYGNPIAEITGKRIGDATIFCMNANLPAVNFRLRRPQVAPTV